MTSGSGAQTAPPPLRPRLAPSLRRLWRDPHTLQLGVAAERAIVLAGIDDSTRLVLPLLDGTRDEAQVLREAEAHGCPRERAARVLGLLHAAGALDDAARTSDLPVQLSLLERDRLAPDLAALRLLRRGDHDDDTLRRRGAARVVVHGAGRVGAPVALLLASAGVGLIDVLDDGVVRPDDCGVGGFGLTDVGAHRAATLRRLIRETAPAARTATIVTPHLVLLTPPAGRGVPPAPEHDPSLLARVVDGIGVVGPLVQPAASACLHCLDLHRTDLDPGWPILAAQLSDDAGELVACDGALALAVAAQAAREALAFLDGNRPPGSLGGTLELAPTDWRWRRRSWQVHPDCSCMNRTVVTVPPGGQ